MRTRLAAEKAAWNSLLSDGPVLPALLRHPVGILQLTENLASPSTMESSPEATLKACSTARDSWCTYEARRQVQMIAMMAFQPLRQLRAAGGAAQYTSVRLQVDRITASVTPAFLPQCAQSGQQPFLAERHLFAQRDRRGLMVDAEDVECH